MLTVTDEVRDALASGQPVVALESTIISHGMPYPQNVAMATEVEGIVREHRVLPRQAHDTSTGIRGPCGFRADQQDAAEPVLERANALTHGGRGDVQPSGGGVHRARIDDGCQGLGKLHRDLFHKLSLRSQRNPHWS